MAFTRNRPTASELLQNSQSLIYNNFNDSDTSFGVEHFQFSDTSANNGRHKIVGQLAETATGSGVFRTRSGVGAVTANFPATVASVNQLFVANYTPDYTGSTVDTQLFAKTGAGVVSQLTGYSGQEDGWQWVGGLLIQWGFVSQTTSVANQTLTFKDRVAGPNIAFPNNCFNVTATVAINGALSTSAVNQIYIFKNNGPSPSKDNFHWTLVANSSNVRGFFWVAIGN